MIATDRLPEKDDFGNYWFVDGEKRCSGPAIFPSKRMLYMDPVPTIVENGSYIVWTGSEFLWNGRDFQRFRTPHMALMALGERLAVPN